MVPTSVLKHVVIQLFQCPLICGHKQECSLVHKRSHHLRIVSFSVLVVVQIFGHHGGGVAQLDGRHSASGEEVHTKNLGMLCELLSEHGQRTAGHRTDLQRGRACLRHSAQRECEHEQAEHGFIMGRRKLGCQRQGVRLGFPA